MITLNRNQKITLMVLVPLVISIGIVSILAANQNNLSLDATQPTAQVWLYLEIDGSEILGESTVGRCS